MRLQLRTVQVYMRLFHVRTATWPVRPPKASLSVEMSRGSCCRLWWLVVASPPIQWWLTRCPAGPMQAALVRREHARRRYGCARTCARGARCPTGRHRVKRSGERQDLSWVSESVARATCRMHIRQGRPSPSVDARSRSSIYLSIPAMNATLIRADCGESACGLVEAKDVARHLSLRLVLTVFDPCDPRRLMHPTRATSRGCNGWTRSRDGWRNAWH